MRTVAPPSLGTRLAGAVVGMGLRGRALVARDPAMALGVSAFALFTGLVAANALTGQPGPHPRPMFATRLPAAAAAPGVDPMVKGIQEGLTRTGHYGGSVDGVAGPATEAAIRRFQADWGLEPTGRATPALEVAVRNAATIAETRPPVDEETRVASIEQRMGGPETLTDAPEAGTLPPASAAASTAAEPDERERVRLIQVGLASANVAELTADGIAGPATRRAIETFQALEGMDVTGQPSAEVLGRLRDLGLAP